MNVFVVTHSPSPYQVELFNAVAARNEIKIHVAYLFSGDPTRQWSRAEIHHNAMMLDGDAEKFSGALSATQQADLVVFNFYNDRFATGLIQARAESHKPWAFWGERPGFRAVSFLGRMARRWKLRRLHSSNAPIWGIGEFAMNGYRAEFGHKRSHVDLPYFSNLDSFMELTRTTESRARTILFSGSLIPRKGVDLLARAFCNVAQDVRDVRLQIVGAGEMRSALERELSGFKERVEFFGFYDWHKLASAYAGADVLCVPSRYDGWGLVVPEGLASGMPVIGTDRMGAALEFLETGRNGWLIPAGDSPLLEAALREAATMSAEKLATMSAAARNSVKGHTLKHGAQRFFTAAREAVANWKH